ncbi:hypothetical protein KIH74_33160 [Kineosporia sp. J2-2]|uniref:Uncharacterized protein n=1 Tax=Kineosporia corallincola TaxID=2835133 RepID=A0ABS5TST0_9ACTN|nr:hypothetical protein [Kineosporia corallincola]MBT0773841.1 hypothetical protein [Kineosporia corallincola]
MTQMFANDAPMVMPGKGVRPIRCVGCARDTLPRHADGAPLCPRCSDVLASAALGGAAVALPRPTRWFWRRDDV